MRVLLDTHILLWWATDDERLTERMRSVVADPLSELYWSTASSWEVGIKYASGRLPLPEPPASYIPGRVARYRIRALPILDAHVFRAAELPLHHRDPFDRMLVAQAQQERLRIVSSDVLLAAYDVEVLK